MHQANYQTVKLGKGRHRSPAHGACVTELASMIAAERFTDHPRTVSSTIAKFLRQAAARYAISAIRRPSDEMHHSVLALIDELTETDCPPRGRMTLKPLSEGEVGITMPSLAA